MKVILGAVGRRIPLWKLHERFEKVTNRYNTSLKANYFYNGLALWKDEIFRTQILENSKWIDFEDEKILISSEADEILRIHYGDYLKLPL